MRLLPDRLTLVLLALWAAALGVLWRASETPPAAPSVTQPPPALAPEPPPAAPPAAPAPARTAWTVELDGVAGLPAARRRTTTVDLKPVNGRPQRVDVVYDLDAVTRPTTLQALERGPDWVPGVRLLLGEMGAWRLQAGKWSLLEGVGILETVANRFEPDLANPLRVKAFHDWPGCGPGGTFATCIDPAQYLGMSTDRALRPREAVPDEDVLLAGLDRAVAAWYVYEEALLGETTAGATSFVHLCGGAAYGKPAATCAADGGDPNRGPILYRGPSAWIKKKGRYSLDTLAVIDFVEGEPPADEKAYPTYLQQADPGPYVGTP